ncbi:PREDICTED: uncharacterized protein LOC101308901 [Fragaria vesca subsp. vesca]
MASPSDSYVDPRDDTDSDEERPGSAEETEMVSVSDEFPDRRVTIGIGQALRVRAALISFLKKNSGAFAWTYKDMPGISSGKFLGHIISRRGIEANPEKIQAILDMERPKERNKVSSLAGKIVALARFVSRLTDKCAPFFRLLKDQQCKEISAVSSVLIRKESDIEHAVFYAGKGFTPAESRYLDVEKLALALIITARRLRHYFQAHSITLYTNHPLRQIMQKPKISGRLVKWGEFDIHYQPRVAIKGQTAADFISELTPMKVMGKSSKLTPTKVVGVSSETGQEESGPGADKEMHNEEPPAQLWRLFVDGSVTRNKSGAGIILETPDGFKHEYALEFQFKASNNATEYEALIGGLQLARDVGVERVEVFSDS